MSCFMILSRNIVAMELQDIAQQAVTLDHNLLLYKTQISLFLYFIVRGCVSILRLLSDGPNEIVK